MTVKTTKIQCNQDVDVRGKVDIEGKVTCGGDLEVDEGIYADGRDVTIGGTIPEGHVLSPTKFPRGVGLVIITKGSNKYGFVGTTYLAPNSSKYYAGILFNFWPTSNDVRAGIFVDEPHAITDVNAITLDNTLKQHPFYFRHSLTLTCGTTATYYIDYYSKNSLIVDSIQDLSTITGKHSFGCGSAQATFTSNVWKIGENAITAVADDVHAVTD